MSEIGTARESLPDARWTLLAIARDDRTSEQWQDALDDAGIESEVRIEDAVLTGRSSMLTQLNSPTDAQLFSFALWVPTTAREDAARALVDAGWDGNHGQRSNAISTGFALRGALFALAAAAAVIIVRLVRT